MNILVPTDFSKLSKVAVEYALKLLGDAGGKITLLHVVYIDGPPKAQASLKTGQILNALVKNAENDFAALCHELKVDKGSNLSYKVIKGHPIEDVIDFYATHNDIDLIVMGTKGASGVKKVLMGSNAAAVIGSSEIPVLTVPEHARYRGIKQIVYASDLKKIGKELKTVTRFADLLGSSIRILHVLPVTSKKGIGRAKLKETLIRKFEFPKISIDIIPNDSIVEAIDEYISDSSADVLTMFTHKPTFFEKLFGRSVTQKMAFHTWIPLLAIKK